MSVKGPAHTAMIGKARGQCLSHSPLKVKGRDQAEPPMPASPTETDLCSYAVNPSETR